MCESHVVTSVDRTTSIFDLEICQVIKLSVLTFSRSMSCSMSIEQKIVQSENISTPIYVECNKMYRSKVCVQEFSYFVSGLDIQLEQSENDSPVRKKIGCRWRNTTSHTVTYTRFFGQTIRSYGLVVKKSRSELVGMGSIPTGC